MAVSMECGKMEYQQKIDHLNELLDQYKGECLQLQEENKRKNADIKTSEVLQATQQIQWEVDKTKYQKKIKQLDEALKAKGKQLVDLINRDRGEKRFVDGSKSFCLLTA